VGLRGNSRDEETRTSRLTQTVTGREEPGAPGSRGDPRDTAATWRWVHTDLVADRKRHHDGATPQGISIVARVGRRSGSGWPGRPGGTRAAIAAGDYPRVYWLKDQLAGDPSKVRVDGRSNCGEGAPRNRRPILSPNRIQETGVPRR
jgi:hypothetical protein